MEAYYKSRTDKEKKEDREWAAFASKSPWHLKGDE
jgi:hypothetical protein